MLHVLLLLSLRLLTSLLVFLSPAVGDALLLPAVGFALVLPAVGFALVLPAVGFALVLPAVGFALSILFIISLLLLGMLFFGSPELLTY